MHVDFLGVDFGSVAEARGQEWLGYRWAYPDLAIYTPDGFSAASTQLRRVRRGGLLVVVVDSETWTRSEVRWSKRQPWDPEGDLQNTHVLHQNLKMGAVGALAGMAGAQQTDFILLSSAKNLYSWYPAIDYLLETCDEAVRRTATALCPYGSKKHEVVMGIGTTPVVDKLYRKCLDRSHMDSGQLTTVPWSFRAAVLEGVAERPKDARLGHDVPRIRVQRESFIANDTMPHWKETETGSKPMLPMYTEEPTPSSSSTSGPTEDGSCNEQDPAPTVLGLGEKNNSFPVLNPGRWPLPRQPGPSDRGDAYEQAQRRTRMQSSPPVVWTPEAKEAWERAKMIIASAVALNVPDWEGARTGANPLIYMTDRSKFAVGGGLFQRAPVGDPSIPSPMWGQLRPIAMWSKSLDKTQQNWSVWEGELYSAREGLHHLRDIVALMHVMIGTDHLNNLIIHSEQEFRQPGKILNWIQEIEALVIAHWAFTPGAANVFADYFSRNPPDREEAETIAADKVGLPRSLVEAFAQVISREGSTSRIAVKADKDVQEARTVMRRMVEGHLVGEPLCSIMPRVEPSYCIGEALRPQKEGVTTATNATPYLTRRVFLTLCFPGCVPEDEIAVPPKATGPEAELKTQAVVEPPLVLDEGTKKYFELRDDKQADSKTRSAVLDNILYVLRQVKQFGPTALMVHGEAGIACLATMHGELREDAYKIRRVQQKERDQFNTAWERVEAIVFLTPAGFRLGRIWRRLTHAVPELLLPVRVQKHVWGLLPTRDAARAEAKVILGLITGPSKVVTEAGMEGPTYLKLPTKLPELPFGRRTLPPAPTETRDDEFGCPIGSVETPTPWVCGKCVNASSHKAHENVPVRCRWWPGYGGKGGPLLGPPRWKSSETSRSDPVPAAAVQVGGSSASSSSTALPAAAAGAVAVGKPEVLAIEGVPEGVGKKKGAARRRPRRPAQPGADEGATLLEQAGLGPDKATPSMSSTAVLPEEIEMEMDEPKDTPKPLLEGYSAAVEPSGGAPLQEDDEWLPNQFAGAEAAAERAGGKGTLGGFWRGDYNLMTGAGEVLPITKLRGELKEAQCQDPKLKEIICYLRGYRLSSFLADPRRDADKVRERALNHTLEGPDKLLCRVNLPGLEPDEAVPVIPQVAYCGEAKLPGAPPNLTWPAVMCGLAHFTPHGGHATPTGMMDNLWGVVYWGSREGMYKSCQTVYLRCRACTAQKKPAKVPARLRRNRQRRPFVRIQIDLYEVTPQGEEGETHVFTAFCVHCRFPFFRNQKGKTAKATAASLFDIILDMGVVPLTIHSDLGKEFVNDLVGELLSLLGSSQIFSSAVHLQTLGIAERPHRDMTALMAMLLQSVVAKMASKWPQHTRTLEARIRDKPLGGSGLTPRAIANAWFATTPLQSALGAVEEIPRDLPYHEFLVSLVADFHVLNEEWQSWELEADRKAEEWYNEQKRSGRGFKEGELVLLAKGELERKAGGKLLPRADGPYAIATLPSEHVATLEDPFSKRPVYDGRPQSTSRLVHFMFPRAALVPTDSERRDAELVEFGEVMPAGEAELLQEKDVVAVKDGDSAFLIVVDSNHNAQREVTGRRLTATGSGAWAGRVWVVDPTVAETGLSREKYEDLLCVVELENARLTPGSIETMRKKAIVA